MKSYSLLIFLVTISSWGFAQTTHQWKGTWITRTEDTGSPRAPYLRKSFIVRKPLAAAQLNICGLGYPVTTINGKAISHAVLDQAFTRYDKTLLYQTYDVKRLLHPGTNAIGVELGNGWYNLQTSTIWSFNKIPWRKSPRLILDLVLTYTDGTRDTIGTDQTWKTQDGPSQFNSLIAGEIFDARKEIPSWNTASFDDRKWAAAIITQSPGGDLKPQQMPAVKVIREITPHSLKHNATGRWVFDLDENFSGVVRLTITGKAGDTITLYHNELLAKDGSVDRKANTGHMNGPASDPFFQTDQYILHGEGTEVYTPRFTYHGFRYVELRSSNPNLKITKATIKGLFYSTHFKPAGTFTSSSAMLNQLYAAAIRSYRSNFVSIPTDCPQREKMGWLADAWVCADLGLWNFDAASSYRKYLADIRDVQLPDGSFAGIAPTNRIGYRWIDPADPDFGPCWASALTQITSALFRHTADTAILRENYEANQRYAAYLLKKVRSRGYLYRSGLGDFLAIEETPKNITSTALVYQDLQLIGEMANLLDKKTEAAIYQQAADTVRSAFNATYFNAEKQSYKVKTLTALSMILECGLCPENAKSNVAIQLAEGIRSRNYQANFGVMGTKFVLQALSNNGYATEAYRLLTNTDAGWGRWIKQGATTLWEGWEPKDQSYNHVFFGDFAAWYFRALGGLSTTDGFRRFRVKPAFPKGLHSVSITHRSPYGMIRISWHQTGSTVKLNLTVPKGSKATIELPGQHRSCKPGTYLFQCKL